MSYACNWRGGKGEQSQWQLNSNVWNKQDGCRKLKHREPIKKQQMQYNVVFKVPENFHLWFLSTAVHLGHVGSKDATKPCFFFFPSLSVRVPAFRYSSVPIPIRKWLKPLLIDRGSHGTFYLALFMFSKFKLVAIKCAQLVHFKRSIFASYVSYHGSRTVAVEKMPPAPPPSFTFTVPHGHWPIVDDHQEQHTG